MLLNKYAKSKVISKDDYAEELLFKIEKNIKNKAELEDRAFPLLHQIVQVFQHEELKLAQSVDVVDKTFAKLLALAGKFEQLAIN